MVNIVINRAIELGKTDSVGKVHMLAITGTLADESAILRNIGLSKAIIRKDVILHQLSSAHWVHNNKNIIELKVCLQWWILILVTK